MYHFFDRDPLPRQPNAMVLTFFYWSFLPNNATSLICSHLMEIARTIADLIWSVHFLHTNMHVCVSYVSIRLTLLSCMTFELCMMLYYTYYITELL